MSEYSDEEMAQIKGLVKKIFTLLKTEKNPDFVDGAAVMLVTARICAPSAESIEFIVKQFENCLIDARVKPERVIH